METLFLTIFVVGILAIPLLYWFSTRETGSKQEQEQGRRAAKKSRQS
jgi:hypothetical protein